MTDCCDPNGLRAVFGEARASSDARKYRRKGLDDDGRRIVDFLVARGMTDRTLLEIGGGIGALQIELLRAGAARAESVEISSAYEDVARELASEARLVERIDRRVGDFAVEHPGMDSADAVVLHHVVCCYPDMPGLVRPAAALARRWLVLTFPADRWWIRSGLRLVSGAQSLFRREFRVFFHEPSAIEAIARSAGLEPALAHRGFFWQLLALERA
ncbi:MAG TPA: methyltransferase domain-containing protein [Candidatus Limnocylindria bacterium]|jgi:magnesium-protoporphyrin O-methyltransferase|nr:methyltransferase domain-containing protein [Candidatus Limnocylindria bacterium]